VFHFRCVCRVCLELKYSYLFSESGVSSGGSTFGFVWRYRIFGFCVVFVSEQRKMVLDELGGQLLERLFTPPQARTDLVDEESFK
jgi:hypothetical protein